MEAKRRDFNGGGGEKREESLCMYARMIKKERKTE
jgi:hypothetical protein